MYLDETASSYVTVPIVLAGVITSWLLYRLSHAIYNITFHPLAKFPGPKLSGAFGAVDLYSTWTGDREKHIRELHEKYGPVVRIQPTGLSFTSAQAWRDIYGFRPGKKQLQKDPKVYIRDRQANLPPSILAADDVTHSNGRRLLANAFSDNALRGQEEILNQYFELLVSRLKEQVDGPEKGRVDMVAWYNWTTFDIIGDLTFGESFHALENRDYHPWIKNIFNSIKYGRWLRLGAMHPVFQYTLNLIYRLVPKVGATNRRHIEYTTEKTKARLAIDTDRKDFITYILRGKDDRAMTEGQLIANSGLLVIAGSETTATLLSGTTYHLLRNPDKFARLQAEVRGAFSSANEMNLVSVGKLPYLHAVLEEGLRMYPPVPTTLPRVTGPGGDIIDGQVVPEGTSLGVHQWSAAFSPLNWTDPESFVPERWLHGDDVPKRYRGDHLDSMQPFSVGPRNCLGKNLAYNEMRAILARMVWHFDLELLPESQQWSQQRTWTLWSKPELMVRLSHSKMVQ